MDVLHDRLIWQVLSGGHAFSPLSTDYRKTHASYPLGTASNPLGSAPALPYALIHRSAWNRNSAKFAFWGFSEVDEESCNKYCNWVIRLVPMLVSVVALANVGGARQPRPLQKEVASMRRIISLVVVALVMAAMMTASAAPVFAQGGGAIVIPCSEQFGDPEMTGVIVLTPGGEPSQFT